MRSQLFLALALIVFLVSACGSSKQQRPDMTGKTVEPTPVEEEEETADATEEEEAVEEETAKGETIDLGLKGEGSGSVQIESNDSSGSDSSGSSKKCRMDDQKCLMKLAEEKKDLIKRKCPSRNEKCVERLLADEIEKVSVKDGKVEVKE